MMEPTKILNETKMPDGFWNRAYEMGVLIEGDDRERYKHGVRLKRMRVCAEDRNCLCNEGMIFLMKDGKNFGEFDSVSHILRIIEESGADTFTIEIFKDSSDTELMFQEFGVKKENVRETVFREAKKIKEVFYGA